MATVPLQPRRSRVTLLLWLGLLALGLWGFHSLGTGWLEAPPLEPSEWGRWAEARDPLVATFAVLRLVVLAIGWYLALTTVIGIVVRLARAPRAIRLADAVTLPAVRRLVSGSLGVSLAAALVVGGPGVPGLGSPAYATTAESATEGVGDDGGGSAAAPLPLQVASGRDGQRPDVEVLPNREVHPGRDSADSDTNVIVLQDLHAGQGQDEVVGADDPNDPPESPDDGLPDLPPTTTVSQTAVDAPNEDTNDGSTVLVQPGDSLWSIASAALTDVLDEQPTDEQVIPYWRALIERNRADLPDPQNPDLIFAGDVIVLPPLSDVRSSG